MTRWMVALALSLAGTVSSLGFDDGALEVMERSKVGKPVAIADVAILMLGSELWCYNEQAGECAWSDIYLSASDERVSFEISHPWSETVDISYVIEAVLRDGRYICEDAFDWIPSVRAYERGSGRPLEGRELAALRAEIGGVVDIAGASACYDYEFRGHDADAQTITLLQRDYAGADGEALGEATVTLHYDPATAQSLGWYW